MIRTDYALFSVLVAAVLWLLVGGSGCAGKGPDADMAELAGDYAIIEGHLAAVPREKLGGRRLVVYLGDPVMPESAPGEDPRPAERLTNIRKAVSDGYAERRYLRDLFEMLAGDPEKGVPGWKVGAEGPVLRLYGEHPRGQWSERIQGVDFVFCFAEYVDPVTLRRDTVDLCFGGRLRDKLLRNFGDRALGLTEKGTKLINPLD